MAEFYFDDFTLGDVLQYGDRPVTADEIAAYQRDFDPLPAQAGVPGAASAWHCCGLLMRLMCDGFILRAASLGAPGIDSVAVHGTVVAGDRLSGRSEVVDLRRSAKRPEMGIVKCRHDLLNQRGEAVLTMIASAFFACRPATP